MTDHKKITELFNSFLKFYKGEYEGGLKQLHKEYGGNSVFKALITNLADGLELPLPDVLIETYNQIYRGYRDRKLTQQDWEKIIDISRKIHDKYPENKWCIGVVLALNMVLDADDKEQRKIQDEIAKEMQAVMDAVDDAA